MMARMFKLEVILPGLLIVFCLLSACTPMVTNKDLVKTTKHPLIPVDWPANEDNTIATLVVVNPYEKRCCGATPSYTVTIRDMFGAEIYKNSELLPIDDFFCIGLKPGFYTVTVNSGQASHSMKLEARTDRDSYIAADVRLSDPAEVLIYAMSKPEALQYVNRAAHRIAPPGENAGRNIRLHDKLNCQSH